VRTLAVAIALASSAAPAQEGTARLDACLAAAADRAAALDCRHIVHDACLAASGSATTIAMAECLHAETQAWDDRLNALWPQVLAQARARDAADRGGGGAHEDALRAAQRAWIGFRDAECAWEYQRWSAGTLRVLFAGSCRLEMTAARVIDFRGWLAEGG